MKIQCACGAKYSFDVTPAMTATPVRFVCPACGVDSSDLVNQLINAQFPAMVHASAPAPPVAIPIPVAVPTSRASSARIASGAASPLAAAQVCLKHTGQTATQQCLVCQKPICPKCMEMFGYVCSVYCQEAAEKNGLELPIYEHQTAVVRARARRKVRLAAAAGVGLFLLLLGVWFWYEYYGSHPRVVFAAKFSAADYQGACKLVPPQSAMLLRGGHLIRYDVAAQKEVWSVDLLDRKQIEASASKWVSEVEAENKRLKKRMAEDRSGWEPKTPSLEESIRDAAAEAASQIHWHVQGNSIWVALPNKVTRYEWETGKVMQEIPLNGALQLFIPSESAIVAVASGGGLGRQTAMRINLADGQVQQEDVSLAAPASVVRRTPSRAARGSDGAADDNAFELIDRSRSEVVADGRNLTQLTVKLIEAKSLAVETMKAPPKKSALEGTVNAAATAAIANEILNEFQREHTGGVEHQDVSRYSVTLKRLLSPEGGEWTGEVVGPAELFPLPTVDVLIAHQHITVFDKANRKLWESALAHRISDVYGWDELAASDTEVFSPCAERDNTLFLFDQGMLTAFELASGHVRWRLPSVGISRLLFDDDGMIYLNTTDADLDQLKHSQQIDVERRNYLVILKVDPKDGRIVWRQRNRGSLTKVTGKFVYAIEWAGGKDDAPMRSGMVPAHLRIYRLDAEDGSVVWEHYQRREPLALDFHRNTIQVLFKKEVQVLKFISF